MKYFMAHFHVWEELLKIQQKIQKNFFSSFWNCIKNSKHSFSIRILESLSLVPFAFMKLKEASKRIPQKKELKIKHAFMLVMRGIKNSEASNNSFQKAERIQRNRRKNFNISFFISLGPHSSA